MKCKRCGNQISDSESYEYLGQILCEDGYIDRYQASIIACDPLAVSAATRSRKKLGLEGAQGLTAQQLAIYEFVKNQGKATAEEIMQKFNLTNSQMQAKLAILRHCELVKGYNDANKNYLVPFS